MTRGYDGVGCSVFLNNRYMDPSVGVFISVDPMVAKTGTAYLYGNGNPTTRSDPSGLDPACQGRNSTEGLCGMGGTFYQYGVRVSVPGRGCTEGCKTRAVGRTQFDFFMAALRYYWNDNHDGLGKASGGFWTVSAKKLSGLDVGGGPLVTILGVSALEARGDVQRGRPSQEIIGDSGWKLDMIDNDSSPARHVWGFVVSAKVWGSNAAQAGLANNESPGRNGASRQDQRSGDAAIPIGGLADMFDDDLRFPLLDALMRRAYYDSSATLDRAPAAVAPEDRSVWWAAINPF